MIFNIRIGNTLYQLVNQELIDDLVLRFDIIKFEIGELLKIKGFGLLEVYSISENVVCLTSKEVDYSTFVNAAHSYLVKVKDDIKVTSRLSNILTVADMSTKLNLSVQRVRTLCKRGDIPAIQLSNDSWIASALDLELIKDRKPGRPKN